MPSPHSKSKRGLWDAFTNLSFSFVGDSLQKISLAQRKSPLGKASLAFPDRAVWSWKFTSQNEPARGLTISTRSEQLVRRKAFSHVHACDDQRIDAATRRGTCPGVADERVGNLAVAEANLKRAIRMLFYSKRSCALPNLKNALRSQKQRKVVRWFLWQEQRWAHGWPPRDEGFAP